MSGKGTIYRDTERRKIAGVVAGLANHFGWNVTYARWAWAIATLFWPPVMIAAYILMAWLLDPMPRSGIAASTSTMSSKLDDIGRGLGLTGGTPEPSPIKNRFVDVRDRFGRLEQRMRSLEKVVTSREFQIDRELRKTGQA
ncbi:MAG: PspC domain-containing protein [Rhodospirillaceae bacterium]|nr:PspC domain-containing protein [Rhodospirillaceae bacterium]